MPPHTTGNSLQHRHRHFQAAERQRQKQLAQFDKHSKTKEKAVMGLSSMHMMFVPSTL
jgi:hypothetical protein